MGRLTIAATQFGDIVNGNYSEFESDGTLKFNGNATVWTDLRVPISNVKVGGTKIPTFTAYRGGLVLAFADQAVEGNEEIAYFLVQLDHSYKHETALSPHVHWASEDGNTLKNVVWKLTYSWADINGMFGAETPLTATAACPEEYYHKLTAFDDITPPALTGDGVSSMLICSISRNSSNVADTYASKSAYLLEVDFHYEKDTVGSRQEAVK